MISTVRSMGLTGVRGYGILVECSLAGGLPGFDVVGLPDAAVKESRERVRSATRNCGFEFPARRITVNLAPADTRKSGSLYDLPILLGLLATSEQIGELPDNCAFVGEVSLSGELRPVTGALPMALAAARDGIRRFFVPYDNGMEAAYADGIEVYAARHLREIVAHVSGGRKIDRVLPAAPEHRDEDLPDFKDVKGQDNVKRALEIAAAGGHNILLIGTPGGGKSMLARRLPSILPDMTRTESLEATELHSIAGQLSRDHPLLVTRPFRSPHHTISTAGMSGGGSVPRPGEISLAHHGVLFLDELPEFQRDVMELLRQPIEDGEVTISRVSGSLTYPCRFMLVGAMNPCRCGWHGHSSNRCRCSPASVQSYLSKVSGPLLDRIDIIVEVAPVEYDELSSRPACETSKDVRTRVNSARAIQQKRLEGTRCDCNARLDQTELARTCELDDDCNRLMREAFDRLRMTARSYDRILRVARTIADLDGAERIAPLHLAEALQYRTTKLR